MKHGTRSHFRECYVRFIWIPAILCILSGCDANRERKRSLAEVSNEVVRAMSDQSLNEEQRKFMAKSLKNIQEYSGPTLDLSRAEVAKIIHGPERPKGNRAFFTNQSSQEKTAENFRRYSLEQVMKDNPELANEFRLDAIRKTPTNAMEWLTKEFQDWNKRFDEGEPFAEILARKSHLGASQVLPAAAEQDSGTMCLVALNLKGLVMERELRLRRALARSANPSVRQLRDELWKIQIDYFKSLTAADAKTAELRKLSPMQLARDVKSIKEKVESKVESIKEKNDDIRKLKAAEKKLRKRAVSMPGAKAQKMLSVAEVQQALPPAGVVVEFLRYGRGFDGIKAMEDLYGAVVICKGLEPQWLVLGSAEEIDKSVTEYVRMMRYSEDTVPHDDSVKRLLHSLYEKLWRPLESKFPAETRSVTLCLDGQLHLVSFATLWKGDRFVAGDYELVNRIGSRSFVGKSKPRIPQNTIEIWANPDYDARAVTGAEKGIGGLLGWLPWIGSSDAAFKQFQALPGTLKDAESLQSVASRAGSFSVKLRAGAEAREFSLGEVASPEVLLLATHGFFHPAADFDLATAGLGTVAHMHNGRSEVDDPLNRSGLALAGANRTIKAWSQKQFPIPSDDGIFTTAEAANLDLENTWLTVLAACDTGIGETLNSETAVNLKMGFVQAGTKNLLFTLWRLDDAYSSDFLARFFERSFNTRNPSTSLSRLQAEELAKLSRTGEPHSFWKAVKKAGPFVLNSTGPVD